MRLDAIRRLWERLRSSQGDPVVLDTDSFTDSERALGHMVLPMLADLESARRTIDDLTRSTRALEVVLRLLPVAAIVLDEEGHFLTSNQAARDLYAGESVPSSLLAIAVRAIREGTEHTASAVSHPNQRGASLRVVPAEIGAAPGPSVVFLVSGAGDRTVEPRKLTTSFGLTTAQARVVALVAEGLTNKEIAERLGISIETVRKHLAASYQKTGVGNRAGVVALAYGARFGQGSPNPPL
jgi:DNA-binding CsgD family transcriptional regulator